jgi:hypothetical protein
MVPAPQNSSGLTLRFNSFLSSLLGAFQIEIIFRRHLLHPRRPGTCNRSCTRSSRQLEAEIPRFSRSFAASERTPEVSGFVTVMGVDSFPGHTRRECRANRPRSVGALCSRGESAFLITSLLLRERRQTDGISLRLFYVRRILRIWPLYLSCWQWPSC